MKNKPLYSSVETMNGCLDAACRDMPQSLGPTSICTVPSPVPSAHAMRKANGSLGTLSAGTGPPPNQTSLPSEGKDLRKLAIACVAVAFVDGNGEGVRRPVLQHTCFGSFRTHYLPPPRVVCVLRQPARTQARSLRNRFMRIIETFVSFVISVIFVIFVTIFMWGRRWV
jgi:hypothetical protein